MSARCTIIIPGFESHWLSSNKVITFRVCGPTSYCYLTSSVFACLISGLVSGEPKGVSDKTHTLHTLKANKDKHLHYCYSSTVHADDNSWWGHTGSSSIDRSSVRSVLLGQLILVTSAYTEILTNPRPLSTLEPPSLFIWHAAEMNSRRTRLEHFTYIPHDF